MRRSVRFVPGAAGLESRALAGVVWVSTSHAPLPEPDEVPPKGGAGDPTVTPPPSSVGG